MRVLSVVIALAISVASLDVMAARPGQAGSGQADLASLAGTASDSNGHALANSNVQLRNVSNGQLVGNTMTNAMGQFNFPSLPAGSYLVEVVNEAGQIVGTSGSVAVSPGWAVTGVTVTVFPATKAPAPSSNNRILGMSPHAAIIVGAATAAGVAGGIAMTSGGTASPSR